MYARKWNLKNNLKINNKCWYLDDMPGCLVHTLLSYTFQMIRKDIHKYILKQEPSRKKKEEEHWPKNVPIYNSPTSHGSGKMEKPPGKCFSGKYISLSWTAILPPKLTKLIIFLGLLEHTADPSRHRLDWNISLQFFSPHAYQLMALKLQP